MARSVWHTAVAATRTTTSPRSGIGTARSTSAKRCGAWRSAARLEKVIARWLIGGCGRSFAPRVKWGGIGGGLLAPSDVGQSHDDGNLFHREVGDDLGAIRVDDQHLLDPHAELVPLAVLGLEREDHAGLDLEGMVQGPDPRDDRRIVLRDPEAV